MAAQCSSALPVHHAVVQQEGGDILHQPVADAAGARERQPVESVRGVHGDLQLHGVVAQIEFVCKK